MFCFSQFNCLSLTLHAVLSSSKFNFNSRCLRQHLFVSRSISESSTEILWIWRTFKCKQIMSTHLLSHATYNNYNKHERIKIKTNERISRRQCRSNSINFSCNLSFFLFNDRCHWCSSREYHYYFSPFLLSSSKLIKYLFTLLTLYKNWNKNPWNFFAKMIYNLFFGIFLFHSHSADCFAFADVIRVAQVSNSVSFLSSHSCARCHIFFDKIKLSSA